MNMTKKEYSEYVKRVSPRSPVIANTFKAFLSGGLICCLGQGLIQMYSGFGLSKQGAATAGSITLILLGAALTGLNIYDNLARFGGAGTLVPITGFANAVVAPALEFKSEGYVLGMSSKMFIIAGPVIVFGLSSSIVYGLILNLIS
jgi:stage V sporulation protein AC